MADVLVPLIVFMTPVLLYFTRHYFRLRERQLELQAQGGKLLAAPSAAESNRLKELEERVQNLESIVIALDTERAALTGRPAAALPGTESPGPRKLPAQGTAAGVDSGGGSED